MAQNDLGTQLEFQQPYIQENPVQPSGYMGTAGKLAEFASKFLEGASRGRALAFQRSEQQRNQSILGLRAAMDEVTRANIPDDMKQKLLSPLGRQFASLVANSDNGQGANSDNGQGKDKTKKGGGQKSQDGQGHPMQGFTEAIKGFASRMLGPGAEKQSVSPKDVNSILGQTFAALKSTPTIPVINENLDQSYASVYNAQKQARGRDLTQSEQLAIPALAGIISKSQQLNQGKLSSVIGGFLSTGGEREKEETPEYKATVAAKQAETKRYEAEAGYYSRGAAAGQKTTQYKGTDGKTYEERDGQIFRPGSKTPVAEDQIDKLNLQPYTKPTADKTTFKIDRNGVGQVVDLTSGKTTAIPGLKFDTPAQLQAAREIAQDARQRARSSHGNAKAVAASRAAFDRLREATENAQNIEPEDKKAMLGKIEEDRRKFEDELQTEDETPPAGSSNPPSGSRPPLSSFDKSK